MSEVEIKSTLPLSEVVVEPGVVDGDLEVDAQDVDELTEPYAAAVPPPPKTLPVYENGVLMSVPPTSDSDFVTANAELLRSHLAAVSMEAFIPVESSSSVFSSQRPLVPYFFGRPDPLQRSYSTQYNFCDLVATGEHRTPITLHTPQVRRARRAAAVASLKHPTEEELAILRAQNPELYMRLAYGRTLKNDAPGVVPDAHAEMPRVIEFDSAEDYSSDEEDIEDGLEPTIYAQQAFPRAAGHPHIHASTFGTHSHPTPTPHRAHAQIHTASQKGARNSTNAAPPRQTYSVTTAMPNGKSTGKYHAMGKRLPAEVAMKRPKNMSDSHAIPSNYWVKPNANTSANSAATVISHLKSDSGARASKNAPSSNQAANWPEMKERDEERQKAKEFWRTLPEEQRGSLIKAEKEQIMKKLKEQQKQPSCACELCGKRRVAIEEELEMLYDAYYHELEKFSGNTSESPVDPKSWSLDAPTGARTPANPPQTPASASSANASKAQGGDGQSMAQWLSRHPGSTGHSGPASHSSSSSASAGHAAHHHHHGSGRGGDHRKSLFGFNSSNLLSVADDFMKNDGKKFVEMMEELADAKLRREMRLNSLNGDYPSSEYDGSVYDEEDDRDELEDDDGDGDRHDMGEEDEEYDDDEYDDEDGDTDASGGDSYEDEMGRPYSMTDEMKIEEGKQMLQIFAARMFEQRILAAYRDKMTREQQEKLIAEEEERSRQEAAKREQKARKKEREKAKKQQKHLEEIEERKRREKEEEERQRAHKLEMERLAREREDKRREERRREEEEKEKARLALEAKRKAEQERKKAEKAAKAAAKLEETQRLERERLERERQANFIANERRKAEAAAKAQQEAAQATQVAKSENSASASKSEPPHLATAAQRPETQSKPEAATKTEGESKTNAATKPAAAQNAQPTQTKGVKASATSTPTPAPGSKKKALKSPLLPLEPPKEPPTAAAKKTSSATASSAASKTPSTPSNAKQVAATQADSAKEVPGSTPKRGNAKSTATPPKGAAVSPTASNNITPVIKQRPRQDSNGNALPLPQNPKPLPARPPPPRTTASTVPPSFSALQDSSLFGSSPLLTSQELQAPVGKSWDALAAGLGHTYTTTTTDVSQLPLLPGSVTNSTFAALAGMNDSDLIFPTPSPSSASSTPIDPLWLGTPVDMSSTLLTGASGTSGNGKSHTDSFMDFPSLLGGPHLGPMSPSSSTPPIANQSGETSATSSENRATGLRGLLSDEDEVVVGHTLNNGLNSHFATSGHTSTTNNGHNHTSSSPSPPSLSSTASLFPMQSNGTASTNTPETSGQHLEGSYNGLPTFSSGFGGSSLFSSTDAFQRPSVGMMPSTSGVPGLNSTNPTMGGVDQLWSRFGQPSGLQSSATSFSSLLSGPPGFDSSPLPTGNAYSDFSATSSLQSSWGYPLTSPATSNEETAGAANGTAAGYQTGGYGSTPHILSSNPTSFSYGNFSTSAGLGSASATNSAYYNNLFSQ